MAHFARMNSSHEVKQLFFIEDSKILDPDTGDESETVGIVMVKLANPGACATGGYWKQCSYNTLKGVHANGGTPLRGNYPAYGWFYDSTKDVFHAGRPTDVNGNSCASWTLNSSTGVWEAPLTKPTIDNDSNLSKSDPNWDSRWYGWDESAYQADNTTGWVLKNQED